jgi:hypothetical protein
MDFWIKSYRLEKLLGAKQTFQEFFLGNSIILEWLEGLGT